MTAFGDLGLALGALALEGGPEVARFRLRRGADVAPCRRFGGTLSPAPDPHGVLLAVPRAALVAAAAAGDPTAQVLAAAEAAREAPPPRVEVMGVVNVTPDSFSDGGETYDADAAVAHGLALARDGAAILDVGGESTRPGAAPVPADEQRRRVVPVVRALAAARVARVSVDTTSAAVAEAALEAGASLVNDVSAGEDDPRLLEVVSRAGVDVVLMHRQGTPATMQHDPCYGDVVLDVADQLRRRTRAALDHGVAAGRIWLDPGIGFGKRLPHNLALLARLGELRSLGQPLLVGPSRKSFIAHVMEADEGWAPGAAAPRDAAHAAVPPSDRLGGTAAAVTAAVFGGASVIRVHDVRMMVQAARVAAAIRGAS